VIMYCTLDSQQQLVLLAYSSFQAQQPLMKYHHSDLCILASFIFTWTTVYILHVVVSQTCMCQVDITFHSLPVDQRIWPILVLIFTIAYCPFDCQCCVKVSIVKHCSSVYSGVNCYSIGVIFLCQFLAASLPPEEHSPLSVMLYYATA